MESGQHDLEKFLTTNIASIDALHCRLVLRRDTDKWTLVNLIADSSNSAGQNDWAVYDYGNIVFLNLQLTGDELSSWLIRGIGQANGYDFGIPKLQNQVQWTRYTSHFRNAGIYGIAKPYSLYRIGAAEANFAAQGNAFTPLVKDKCPSFPDYDSAVYRLLLDIEHRSGQSPPNEPITIRLTHADAWIEQLIIEPRAIEIEIQGSNVDGVRLVIGGSGSLHIDEEVVPKEKYRYEFVDRLYDRLWVILSRGDRWLDSRVIDFVGLSYFNCWGNVVIKPGTICEHIQQLILEGENNRVEFKIEVPGIEKRFVKTVAAFANGSGGTIIVGVENGTGRIEGLKGDITDHKDSIANCIHNNLVPEPIYWLDDCEIDHRKVIAVRVEEGTSPPYGLREKSLVVYVRRGSTTFQADQPTIRALSRKGITPSVEKIL